MRIRRIVVPNDKKVQIALNYDLANDQELLMLQLSDEDFSFLINHGILEKINDLSSAIIDDYEDDSVLEPQYLREIIKFIKQEKKHLDKEKFLLVDKIQFLFEQALNRNTGVYFYF